MILTHILQDHNPWLLLLAVGTGLFGAAAGTVFWARSLTSSGHGRFDWGLLASLVLGATIWTTHFVAMLGYTGSAFASFDVGLTALSVVIAIIGIAVAILVSVFLRGLTGDLVSGATLGAAIATMHFTGMFGFRLEAPTNWNTLWAPDAVLIGMALGICTVRLLRSGRSEWASVKFAALAFTVTVASVHFTAMAIFHERIMATATGGATIEHFGLGVAVSVVAFLLISTAVAGFLIQERNAAAAAERLRASARTDPMTGVLNRGGFNRALDEQCRSARDDGPDFALLFVDLDRFHVVNDNFGHPIGDKVLTRVVGRLRSALGPDDVIARLGGDEFAIIMSLADLDDGRVELVGERIVDVMARPFLVDAKMVEIAASIGICEPEAEDFDEPSTLIRKTDMALHAAKSSGRDTWMRFDAAIAEQFEKRRQLEFALRRAVVRSEFELYFQPLVDCKTGAYKGAEALLRWRQPDRQFVSPAIFVPLAEELGLVTEIGKWVLEKACMTAATWPEDLSVSVNISPMQLKDPHIVQTVVNALERSGLTANRLELEVTETALFVSEDSGRQVLNQLQALGVSLALDDFGTGFSSLSHLHSYPLDRIKIDRSFVERTESDPKSAKLVEAIGALGTTLGFGVTAEGIETEGQLSFIRGKGCDTLQGYLFSKPVPADEFLDLVTSDPAEFPQRKQAAS